MNNFRFYKEFILIIILACTGLTLNAQSVYRNIYLIGNAANVDQKWVKDFIEIHDDSTPNNIIFLGDITDEDGIKNKPKKKNEKRLKAYKKLKKNTKGKVHFLSGDRDWDNSGEQGKRKVKNLETYIERDLKMKKAFVPSLACPGPYVIEADQRTTIIAVNSQWFLHPHDRPEAPDTDCPILFEQDFWEEFEDLLDDNDDKNVIVVAHHPIYSNGPHNGKKLGMLHLVPFVGTMYGSFKKQIGTPRDFAHPAYQNYLHKMRNIMHDHQSVIYASGHDFFTQVMHYDGNYFLNTSLSNASRYGKDKHVLYSSSDPTIAQVSLYDNGRIEAVIHRKIRGEWKPHTIKLLSSCHEGDNDYNHRIDPCALEAKESDDYVYDYANLEKEKKVAGSEYKASRLTKILMGRNYRPEWTDTIAVSILNLNQKYGGLKAYARGGGLQTNSLKFKAGDGNRYVFRAVDKNPERALDELTAQTIYRKITKQLITTQFPYGGIVAAHLLGQTDIIHATPELYVMPNDPQLGIYREAFAHVLGTLEIKPRTKKKEKSFGDSDGIVASNQMLRSMYKSNRNRIDKMAYGKARVFDMFLGDWDRHEDNWKWAEFKTKKGHLYKPIPRDRDHVFSKWEGFIPWVSTKVIPNSTNFGYEFVNVWHLNFKASHLDRRLGAELTRADWMEACKYVQSKMTDEVLQEAFEQLPGDLTDIHEEEIISKLKNRRDHLEKAVSQLLDILNKEVDIVGSNKSEYFKVTRLQNGNVKVEMYHVTNKGNIKELLFSREFQYGDTEEIYLFGLDGKDQFDIEGESKESIKVRIIPGGKKDKVVDRSIVQNGGKLTQVYQNKNEHDDVASSNSTLVKFPYHNAEYDFYRFKLNSLVPIPGFQSGGANGAGYTMTVLRTIQGFNKPDFAHRYRFKAKYFPSVDGYRLDARYRFRHFYKDWDFFTSTLFSNSYDRFPFFYGLGNDSTIDKDLEEGDYYDIDLKTYRVKLGLSNDFWQTSEFSVLLDYEFNQILKDDDALGSIFDEELYQDGFLGRFHNLGVEFDLNLDFRDHQISTYQGSQFKINHRLLLLLNDNSSNDYDQLASVVKSQFSHYETFNIGLPLTMIGRIGSSNTIGQLPFFNQGILGNRNFLRAFERNRFIDQQVSYLNLEGRLKLGTWYNVLTPVEFGIFAFTDLGNAYSDFTEFKNNQWRQSRGIGFFAAPYDRNFTISMSYGVNDEDRPFFDIRFGFDLQ